MQLCYAMRPTRRVRADDVHGVSLYHGVRVWSVLEVSQSFGVVLLVAAQLSRCLSTPQPPSKAQYLQSINHNNSLLSSYVKLALRNTNVRNGCVSICRHADFGLLDMATKHSSSRALGTSLASQPVL